MPSLTILVFIQQSSPFAETFDENLMSFDLYTKSHAAFFAEAMHRVVIVTAATAADGVAGLTVAWMTTCYQDIICKSRSTCKFITGMVS